MNISLLRKRALEAGVAVPAIVLMSAGFAAPAYAQDASATRADTCDKTTDTNCQDTNTTGAASNVILVTGSILGRTDTETPSPVTVLSTEELENRGINTVAEGLQRISANGSGAISEGWNNGNNFAAGGNAVSLRGLTVQNTLTVFDGLRMAPYPIADDGHRNFVDLNTIPDAIVDRIEVLKDGASSTYGADAVAGVVNIITKKEIQGIHANIAGGLSQEGDGGEIRGDFAAGYGDLEDKGFNVYVAGTYRKNDVIWARDRDYPFNTGNLSGICEPGAPATGLTTQCMAIPTRWYTFGVNRDGSRGGTTFSDFPLVAPSTAGAARRGEYQLLNPDCAAFGAIPQTLPNSARTLATTGLLAGTYTYAANVCQKDYKQAYATLRPSSERYGVAARATVRLGDKAEAYIAGNYMHVDTYSQITPSPYGQTTTPPPSSVTYFSTLPQYVCPGGTATIAATGVTTYSCTAASPGAVLNPDNPFAANGGGVGGAANTTALLLGRFPFPETVQTVARALRGAAGINGTLGSNDEWHYQVEFTASQVELHRISENYIIPQRLADKLATGEYHVRDPFTNTPAILEYVAPRNEKVSTSELWQASAIVSRSLFELPGGPLQAAVGAAYRHEAINDQSANPENLAHPFDRPFTINAVGAVGSRNVWSAFYEVNAPILDSLEVNASGRYDDYSSGQTNFSPKFGVKFKPIEQVLLRATWSKGFRIPSFNEAFGLPTTGYTTLSVNCTTYAAFCAAHPSGNPAPASPYNTYATGQYPLGRTSVGNPGLAPEKSTSWTAGVVIEPFRNFSFTVDYFNIETTDVIANISANDQAAALDAYFKNGTTTGVVPGVTIIPGTPDNAFPTARALPQFIQFSFQNADTQKVSGVDFGLNYKHNFGMVRWNSSIDASYILDYKIIRADGSVEDYEGTLSPCDYTSCSGTPQLRANWSNTFGYGPFNLNVTAYYTEGYDLASIDYGGVKGDCTASIGASVVTYQDGTPVQCIGEETWNVDLTANYEINDHATVYLNVLNVLGIDPPFDPSAAYSIFQYNPTWAQSNIVGRYFRIGAKVDF
jgi:iron complex outermembrane receptor protein